MGAILAEGLPDDYIVVERPTVQGRVLDTVIFGPQGLVVLHIRDWAGEIEPSRHGDWHVRLPSGERLSQANPARDAAGAEAALRAFFRDEFPGVTPAIHQTLVLTDPDAAVVGEPPPGLPVVMLAGLVGAIESLAPPPAGGLPDPAQRETLAIALRERRLTVSQRAREPFVFRAGGVFGSGKKVWTVRQAVAHMDAHPEDGVYHLQNDTFAQWLEAQGAPHLATLARAALRGRESDPRAAVERFLIGTGLVARPVLEVRPSPVNLGCVVAGEKSSARIHVRKGRGRGYLFGRLSSGAAWLRVEPHEFSGRPLAATVIADSAGLPIQQAPSQAELLVESSASEAPVTRWRSGGRDGMGPWRSRPRSGWRCWSGCGWRCAAAWRASMRAWPVWSAISRTAFRPSAGSSGRSRRPSIGWQNAAWSWRRNCVARIGWRPSAKWSPEWRTRSVIR